MQFVACMRVVGGLVFDMSEEVPYLPKLGISYWWTPEDSDWDALTVEITEIEVHRLVFGDEKQRLPLCVTRLV